MKPCFLLAAMTLACGPAFAQAGASLVDGDWVGKGSFQIGPSILACTEIKMKFVGGPTLYGVRNAFMECENFKKASPMHADFDVKPDNEVYYRDRKVGSIAENRLTVLVPGNDEVATEFTLRREGAFLYYNEVARAPGQPPVFGMVAIMKKDPIAGSAQP